MTTPLTAFWTWAKDIVERSASTFAVVAIPLLFAGTTIDADLGTQAATAGLAAAASVLKTAALPANGFGVLWLDIGSRTAWSAIQAAAAVAAADGFNWFSPTAWQTAALIGGAAAGSVVKGLIADRITSHTITPASLVQPAES